MHSPELIEILLTILKAVVILLVVVTCGASLSFGERRCWVCSRTVTDLPVLAGAVRSELVADMIKLFFKEDSIPKFSDRVIFTLGTDDCLYLAAARLCDCASQSG
ncbi:hypothetical protein ACLK19_15140 [Escherichia coli]